MPVKYTYTFLLLFAGYFFGFTQTKKLDNWLIKADQLRDVDFVNASFYADSAYNYAIKTGNRLYLAQAYNAYGNLQLSKGNYNKALELLNKGFAIATTEKSKITLANIINNKAICYERLGNYNVALQLHLQSLKLREEIGNLREILIGLQNLGVTYFFIADGVSAMKYTQKAMEMAIKVKDSVALCNLYDNLGACYYNDFKDSLALDCYLKALGIAKLLKYDKGIESSSANLAAYYVETGKSDLAKYYLKNAMSFMDKNPMTKISLLYNLGGMFEKLNRPDSAIYYLESALVLAQKISSKHNMMIVCEQLAKVNYNHKNYEAAHSYTKRFYDIKDSLNNEKSQRNIAEIEAIYKTEKQGKEIEFLNAENKLQKENSENRKKLLWVSLGGLLLAIFAAIAFYLNFRNKKRDNLILQGKNAEIQKQKDLIAEKNKEIVDSINYAKRLQEAILPSVEYIKKQLPLSFVLYKPKDIVAGDFYWMHVGSELKVGSPEKFVLIAVADCTGHGVPGAMVSVVCANALNAAVKEFGLREPAKILDKVNELVEDTFGKSESEVKDGMDISLLKIEMVGELTDNKLPKGKLIIPKGQTLADVVEANKKYNIQWAGANNPLWFIKDGGWSEIKADKQPVGKFEHRKPFTNHSLQLKASDSLFLISDGFADQFGGEQGKKIKNKMLKELLFKNSEQNPLFQKQWLEKEFESWKSGYEQVDDVCIIGIKL